MSGKIRKRYERNKNGMIKYTESMTSENYVYFVHVNCVCNHCKINN